MREDGESSWNDPAVIIGAVALAALFVGIAIAIANGNLLRGGGAPSGPTGSYVVPSGSARLTSTAKLPYPNCAAARADGRSNIPIGDPAYNPALDRNHDGIACGRSDGR